MTLASKTTSEAEPEETHAFVEEQKEVVEVEAMLVGVEETGLGATPLGKED